jgi:hypothetical protein
MMNDQATTEEMQELRRFINEKGELLCQQCGHPFNSEGLWMASEAAHKSGRSELFCDKCGNGIILEKGLPSGATIMPTDKVWIAKAPKVYSTLETGLNFTEVDNEPLAIMAADFGPEDPGNLAYTQVRCFEPHSENVRAINIAHYEAVQKVVFEFDYKSVENQIALYQKIADLIETPSFAIMSGNKSVHFNVYFDHFAYGPDEYQEACFDLYAWLCEQLPQDLKYYGPNAEVPDEDKPFVPDFSMWKGGSRWTRQANGFNSKTGKKQHAKVYHNRHTTLKSIENFSIPKRGE